MEKTGKKYHGPDAALMLRAEIFCFPRFKALCPIQVIKLVCNNCIGRNLERLCDSRRRFPHGLLWNLWWNYEWWFRGAMCHCCGGTAAEEEESMFNQKRNIWLIKDISKFIRRSSDAFGYPQKLVRHGWKAWILNHCSQSSSSSAINSPQFFSRWAKQINMIITICYPKHTWCPDVIAKDSVRQQRLQQLLIQCFIFKT